ncbi:MAG: DUF1292 domain-containing protein [Lachnospiraceae bacterium]|nr:DUF1292 domain-containing protein [Lachnospiraceae bacterium]
MMEHEFQEYITFHVTAKDGTDVEMAVVDEFDFEKEHYVVGAIVEDDTINDDGRYIYRSVMNGDDFTVEKIKREFDYKRIAEVYLRMLEEGEDA